MSSTRGQVQQHAGRCKADVVPAVKGEVQRAHVGELKEQTQLQNRSGGHGWAAGSGAACAHL